MTRVPFPRLKIQGWPDRDRAAWQDAHGTKKRIRKSSPAADWKKPTLDQAENGYGIYLGWMMRDGLLEPDQSVIDRVTEARIARFQDDYAMGRAPHTVANAIAGIALLVRACHPPKGLEWLNRHAWALKNSAESARPKLPRLAMPDELMALGNALMARGKATWAVGERAGLTDFRDGLMIACLASRPLRKSEHYGLRLGESIRRDGGRWHVGIAPSQTKNRRRREFAYPDTITEPMDYYVNEVRGAIPWKPVPGDERRLWLGRRGVLDATGNATRLSNTIEQHVGRRVTVHLFRDCAATAIALHAPEKVGMTKSILGHSTLRTSQEYYNQAQGYSASADLSDMIDNILEGEHE